MSQHDIQPADMPAENWPAEAEHRMAAILQNGNDGEHYAELEARDGCGRCVSCSCEKPKP